MKTALVLGAGGFIGSHMVKSLKQDGYYVRGIDIKLPQFSDSLADEFIIYDLKKLKTLVIYFNIKNLDLTKFISMQQTWVVLAIFLLEKTMQLL